MAENLGSRKLAQVAIVVRDIEESSRRWADALGVEPTNIIVTQPGDECRMTYRGEPSNCRAKLAFYDLGGVQLELIEPIGEESAWHEGLASRGEGVHHLAFWVEGMDQSKAFLDSRGMSLIHRGDMGEGQYAYYDAQDRLGVMLELLEHKRTEIG
jgi:catechol 2,3-dioxygenase-like lactoylglutathione lyase family enzyme